MEQHQNLSRSSGLPVYGDGRRFEVDYRDKESFSLSELEKGRRITLVDDKGRSTTFRVGALSSTDITDPDGTRKEVPYLQIMELEGDGLDTLEKIQPGFYVEGGFLDVQFSPPRERGQESPAKRHGLRLVVNPWKVFPVAITRVEVQERK